MSSEGNQRIVKNTAMLYIRMLFTMAVSLYTSRIVLNTIGVEDFGIYNVVGGLVTMFAFINFAMSTGTQRFLSFELGKNDYNQLSKVFNTSINIHALICVVIFFLAETIGLWFLNTQLTIPAERMDAARWVYHFTIASLIVTIMSVPYNALIIAHERMNIYAYISIVEVVLKLIIVFTLQWFGFDKLKLYAVLIFLVTIIIRLIYSTYSKINFEESKYRLLWDKDLFKSLVTFSSWNLWGSIAGVTFNQGINILLNIFFGPVVNAARGIAYQIDAAVNGFVLNFQTALKPQIIKSYAINDKEYMHELVFKGSKYSFFLLLFLCLPILMETEFVLKTWLKIVPEYVAIFCKLVLINALINSFSGPLMTSAQATGDIKIYQSFMGFLLILNLPVSYVFLKMHYPPQITLVISIVISIIALFSRLIILRSLVELSLKRFFSEVILRALAVGIISLICPLIVIICTTPSIVQRVTIIILTAFSVLFSIYIIGLNRTERKFILDRLINLMH